MNKYMLLLGILFSALCGYTQENLKGVVLTEDKKGTISPLPFANVYWLGTNYGTSTDTNGVFVLARHESARQLVVSFIGFQSDTILIKPNQTTVTVSLKQSVLLDAVTIEKRQTTTTMSFINPIKAELISEQELFKAACCNLSESFETNASVDVNFTDAVTGARQIRMLGLAGPYSVISRENMPGVRGMASTFGLSFIPGSWISSIQVSKGIGSVVNGYESIAGQINVELKKPEEGEQTFVNGFLNQSARMEFNLIHTEEVSKYWSSTLLLHANKRPVENDNNKDGFLDLPKQDQINVMNRWKYDSKDGLMGQIGFHYLHDEKEGGQTTKKQDERKSLDANYNPYLVDINTRRMELFGKAGKVFTNSKYKSMGLQWSIMRHEQDALFGTRIYNGTEESFYANYIYQSIIGNTFHQFKTGLSYLYDSYDEKVEAIDFNRIERVPGAFFEYTYKPSNLFTLVAGIRGDLHNYYGPFVNPRLHLRYAASESVVFRGLAGYGQKTASIFAENLSLFASSRRFQVLNPKNDLPYGLEAERALNMGFNLTKSFRLDYRDGFVSVDLYRTQFEEQVVIDMDQSSSTVYFYNLQGTSVSNSVQVDVSYELIKFLDLKMAYRWVEVITDYNGVERLKPYTPKQRFFANLGYSTRKSLEGGNWLFDITGQWIGEQRLPGTRDKSFSNQRGETAPAFMLWNAQITKNFSEKWAAYIGVENILNYRQNNPIIDAENPFSSEFDATMVWGPLFGRMTYVGFRYSLQKKKMQANP